MAESNRIKKRLFNNIDKPHTGSVWLCLVRCQTEWRKIWASRDEEKLSTIWWNVEHRVRLPLAPVFITYTLIKLWIVCVFCFHFAGKMLDLFEMSSACFVLLSVPFFFGSLYHENCRCFWMFFANKSHEHKQDNDSSFYGTFHSYGTLNWHVICDMP